MFGRQSVDGVLGRKVQRDTPCLLLDVRHVIDDHVSISSLQLPSLWMVKKFTLQNHLYSGSCLFSDIGTSM